LRSQLSCKAWPETGSNPSPRANAAEAAIGQTKFRCVHEGSEAATEGEVVQHAIPGQQHRVRIEQLVENLGVGNAGMLDGEEHEFRLRCARLPA
jgi:hypothetical protein